MRPEELIAAAELNVLVPIPVDRSTLPQESPLAVELLLKTCGGLLLLDTTLHKPVIRFSHLSVQEYLETPNEIWMLALLTRNFWLPNLAYGRFNHLWSFPFTSTLRTTGLGIAGHIKTLCYPRQITRTLSTSCVSHF